MKHQLVGIVNYGSSGNIYNIAKAFEKVGSRVKIIEKKEEFSGIDKIVLPGVGVFFDAMQHLKLIKETLVDQINKKPTLAICLGMQLLSSIGFEFQEAKGLEIIQAEARKMLVKCKVPHIGWGSLEIVRNTPLFKGVNEKDFFYFMHSFEVINYTEIIALTEYCNHKFVSAIQKENVFGVQFHPEKSRESGLKLIENFLSI